MKYQLTLLTDEKSEQEIEYLFEGKKYKMKYEGYKKLSYPIKDYEYAHYYYVDLDMTRFEARLLTGALEGMSWVLKYLLVINEDSNYVIQTRRTIEYYYTLEDENEQNSVEINDQIPPLYVVRCNTTGDKTNPTWEDQADFETLDEAEEFIKQMENK